MSASAKTEYGQTTLYRYDGGTNCQELQSSAGSLAITTELFRAGGLGGGIGSVLYSDETMAPNAAGPWEFFTYNAVGHTTALTDADQNVTQTNVYEAFGDTVAHASPFLWGVFTPTKL